MARPVKNWLRNHLRRFANFYFGEKYPYCNHPDVEVVSAQPVTLKPLRGVCRVCKRGVRATTVWKDI